MIENQYIVVVEYCRVNIVLSFAIIKKIVSLCAFYHWLVIYAGCNQFKRPFIPQPHWLLFSLPSSPFLHPSSHHCHHRHHRHHCHHHHHHHLHHHRQWRPGGLGVGHGGGRRGRGLHVLSADPDGPVAPVHSAHHAGGASRHAAQVRGPAPRGQGADLGSVFMSCATVVCPRRDSPLASC